MTTESSPNGGLECPLCAYLERHQKETELMVDTLQGRIEELEAEVSLYSAREKEEQDKEAWINLFTRGLEEECENHCKELSVAKDRIQYLEERERQAEVYINDQSENYSRLYEERNRLEAEKEKLERDVKQLLKSIDIAKVDVQSERIARKALENTVTELKEIVSYHRGAFTRVDAQARELRESLNDSIKNSAEKLETERARNRQLYKELKEFKDACETKSSYIPRHAQ